MSALRRWGWIGAWALMLGVALATRPPLPLDETRYLAVAWEMWARGDLLVPHLNGVPYSHKPPLLFWLMHAGWAVAGVNAWWPRLVPPLFALATVGLCFALARRLWPGRHETAPATAWLLTGTLLWALYATVLFFDPLVAFFATLGVLGLVRAHERARGGWMLVGLAVGLGLLAKGPALLAWLAPPALAAPWWSGTARARPARWYGALVLALAGGTALAAAWALPAAAAGGPEYARAILWGQTAGRVVNAFAHGRPWWWYLAVLPLLLLPWTLWLPAWRGASRAVRAAAADPGVRLCLAWALPGLAIFSLVSGKQPHYLLPMLPALALLVARGLAGAGGRLAAVPVAALLLAGAAGLAWAALAPDRLPGGWAEPVGGWAVLPALAALALAARRSAGPMALALSGLALLAAAHLGLGPAARPAQDVAPLALRLAALERAGAPVAHGGKYHGQYHFAGRLRRPLAVVQTGRLPAWSRAHPDGWAVVYYGRWDPARVAAWQSAGLIPAWAGPFRGDGVALWPASLLASRPEAILAGAAGR